MSKRHLSTFGARFLGLALQNQKLTLSLGQINTPKDLEYLVDEILESKEAVKTLTLKKPA